MIRIFVTRRVSTFLVVLSCLISAQPAPAQSEKVKAAMQPFVDGGEVAGIVTFIGGKNGLPNSDGSAMRKALHDASVSFRK